jgi:hypothetical protein
MQRTLFGFLSLTTFLAMAAPAAAQEMIDNPQYQEWAKWREGAFVTMRSESSSDGTVQAVMTHTQKLKKLTAEKAVIEITGVTEAAGQTIKSPPMTLEIPAKGPKFNVNPTDTKDPEAKDVPKYKETKGKETLTVKGKQVECEWVQVEVEGGFTTKTWYSEQVPGRIVKSESRAMGNVNVVQLTDFAAEKK